MQNKLSIVKLIMLVSSLGLISCGGGGGSSTAPNPTDPSVSSTSPTEGSKGVLTNTILSITFTKDMDATTLTNSNFTLSGANPVSGSINYNATTRTATFTPDAPLKPGTNYLASVTTSVTDASGKALASVFQGHFTTETFIRRVSVDSSEAQAIDGSYSPNVSADGRYVVFSSSANNLVKGDTNNKRDIFVRDTQVGTTTRVSVNTAGVQANNDSMLPAISADGRYVVFSSGATNLIATGADTNARVDIFMHDTQTNITTRVSISDGEAQANEQSIRSSISNDGRYIAFTSAANNLVIGDTNRQQDIFVRDTQLSTTTRVNVDSNEVQAQASGSGSNKPHISGNGDYVVFESDATNLVANDTNNARDIFVRDIQAGTTTRVSVSNSGAQSTGYNSTPSISADGRYVAFTSYATNLLAGSDTNNTADVFVRDTQLGTTTRVSLSNSGAQSTGTSYSPSISADGRYVAFLSSATNLLGTGADTNNWTDIFVRDTQANTTIRVNLNNNGVVGTGSGMTPSISMNISADGRYVVFNSNATNLAAGGDSNNRDDIFRVLNAAP